MSFLEVTDLVKNYGDVKAVRGFSMSVEPGEIYALVGPDGAGKTSIIRTVCNLLTAEGGTVAVGGHDVMKEFARVKPDLGYMPQIFSLYPDLSVEENLTFYAGIYDVVGPAYIEKRDRMYQFSNLKPFARRRAAALSGGMKQKLALSCALMHDPKLLLLDEPTTGVDPLSRRQFWEILLQLKQQGVTIVVSTPYMDEVARADRGCFLFEGRKLAEGTPEELTQQFHGRVFAIDGRSDAGLVQQLDELPGVSARRFGAGVHIYIEDRDEIGRHADELKALGVAVENLRSVPPDLEDSFIQLMEKSA
jgi:ABC-2 type transport system ATP-binding protein